MVVVVVVVVVETQRALKAMNTSFFSRMQARTRVPWHTLAYSSLRRRTMQSGHSRGIQTSLPKVFLAMRLQCLLEWNILNLVMLSVQYISLSTASSVSVIVGDGDGDDDGRSLPPIVKLTLNRLMPSMRDGTSNCKRSTCMIHKVIWRKPVAAQIAMTSVVAGYCDTIAARD